MMTRGKSICNVLKDIRKQIAKANEIKYEPRECRHKGECLGTCPACETEVKYIERQLDIRRQLGKAVALIGISAGLSALSGCSEKVKKVEQKDIDGLTVGKVAFQPPTHLSGDVEYRSPVDSVIVEKRIDTAKIRTAKFMRSKKAKEETVNTLESQEQVDTIVPKTPPQLMGDVVEQMPAFPGGQKVLMEYLVENIHYTKEMEESCAQGRVIITFVVEKDGSITEAKVVKGIDPAFDEEALRVVKSMPKWIPGKQNGEPVRTKYTVPVTFRSK